MSDELKEFENEHLRYEYSMFIHTYQSLLLKGLSYQLELNVYHESFCVHAYNLMTYLPHDKNETDRFYKQMIVNQIITLSPFGRTMVGKIDAAVRKNIFEHVMKRYGAYIQTKAPA